LTRLGVRVSGRLIWALSVIVDYFSRVQLGYSWGTAG